MACPSAQMQPTNGGLQIPHIQVNSVTISEQAIAEELQYHPAESAERACYQAATALVIRELLLQQVSKLAKGEAPSGDSEAAEEASIEQLLEQQVPVPEADESACKNYYDRNREKFTTPPLVEASHILLAAAPSDDDKRMQTRESAEKLIAELAENDGLFARFAAEYSACPSKDQQGSLGPLSRGQTVAEFERQVFALPQGLAKHPIETRYGHHVVRVYQLAEGQEIPYEQVKDKIAGYLDARVRRRAVRHYLLELISESEIEGIELDNVDSPLIQ